MTKQKYIGIALVVIIIAIGGYFYPGAKTIVQNRVGATPTLDGVDLPYVKINGVETAYVSQPINATSTMLCNIKNPYSSTSTVSRFSVRITSGILGANAYSVSTSSTYYGSSTPVLVLDHNIPTGSQDGMIWLPSSATTSIRVLPGVTSSGESFVFLRNGEYLVARLATTTGAGALASYYQGQCSAEFKRL